MKVSDVIFIKFFSNIFVISLNLSAKYRVPCLVEWWTLEHACEDLNIFNSSPVMRRMKPESETVEWCPALFWTPMIKSANILCIYAVWI